MAPLRTIALAVLLASVSCGPGSDKGGPSFLLVTVDTLRWDALGCYGNARTRTPVLDRLAKESVLFADAQVSAPLTLPSHATIMTGLYPAEHGARYNARVLGADRPTLAGLLKGQGYQTAAFVGSQVLGRSYGMARGFDVFGDSWHRNDSRKGLHGDAERYGSSVVDSFLVWFGERDRSRPFFAWVHLYDPHTPYDPPSPFDGTAEEPYAGEVAYTDHLIGQVFHALSEEGVFHDALVMVVSDHGEGLGEHGESEHGVLLHETTLAIPWIVRSPGGGTERIYPGPVGTIDLLPTAAGLLGLSPEPSWPGRDLTALLTGSGAPPESARYAEATYGRYAYGWAPLYSYREGPWKLVRGTRDELFDLDRDPGETQNLAIREPEVLRRLGGELDEHLNEAAPFEDEEEDLSREEIQMLRSLGYLSSSRGAADNNSLDPRDMNRVHELTLLGFRLANEGAVEEAAPLLREALTFYDRNVEALVWLAFCYRSMGDREKEEETYRTILAIDTSHAQAWNHLGTIFEASGIHDSARICIDRAIRSDSTNTDALTNRGTLRFNDGDRKGAEEDFRRVLRVNSHFAPAHFGMARVHADRGEVEDLIRELKLTLRWDPTHGGARRWLQDLSRRRVDLLYGEE